MNGATGRKRWASISPTRNLPTRSRTSSLRSRRWSPDRVSPCCRRCRSGCRGRDDLALAVDLHDAPGAPDRLRQACAVQRNSAVRGAQLSSRPHRRIGAPALRSGGGVMASGIHGAPELTARKQPCRHKAGGRSFSSCGGP